MTPTATSAHRSAPLTIPTQFDASTDLRNLRLVVAWRPTLTTMQLRRVHTARTVTTALGRAARASLAEIAGRKPVSYTAETTLTPSEVAIVGATHLDTDSLLLSSLSALTFPAARADDFDHDFQFFAYVAGRRGQELVFITKFNLQRGLRRKRVLRWVDEQLTDVTEPVLAFDPDRVDLVWSPSANTMAILNLGVFEFLLRDAPEIVAKNPIKVAQLAAHVPITQGSQGILTAAVQSNSRLRRRLLAIVERGHLSSATPADIQRAFRKSGYRVPDYFEHGKLAVSSDNASTVLQVLNEDVMIGEISKERFAAERKART